MSNEALKGHLELLLLSILADGPAHGYLVIEQLHRRSGGTFDLPEGTVYPALHRLEHDGMLSSSWAESGGRRRRVYRLTPAGRLALVDRQQEWGRFSRAVNATLGN
jgi:PadR family transcriptional regulator PadR